MKRFKKPILCKLGLHKADKCNPITRVVIRGTHKYRTTHIVCKRCGKKLHRITWNKNGGKFDLWTENR